MQNFFKTKLFKIILIFTACLFGMITYEITTGKQTFVEKILVSTAKPVSTTIVKVHNSALDFFNEFFKCTKYKEENDLLKKEIAKNRKMLIELNNLKNENNQLKQALKIKNSNKNFNVEIASFMARNPNDFYGFSVSAGKNKNISEGDVVLTKNGLVGTITKVFDTYSYVSTILSFDVQIPAIDSSKDEKGVICASAEYSKDGITCMKHLNKSTKCEVGDIISTFSHSNYPEELPIGKIKEIIYEKNGMSCIALIEPFENVNCIKDVVIVKRNK